MKKVRNSLAGLGGLGLLVSVAVAQETGHGAALEANLDIIDGIWGTVATLMIGVALVTVALRFFRKAR